MGDRTAIEWADASWNPVRAKHVESGKTGWYCEKVSAGCKSCYAEGINHRLGTGLEYKPGHAAQVEHFLDEKMLMAPLGWRRPRMIFPFSMSDIAGEWVEWKWLDRIFAVAHQTPRHIYMVLTKRPDRLLAYIEAQATGPREDWPRTFGGPGGLIWTRAPWPLPNVWVGTSVEDQPTFDERWAHLRQIPAAVRWFSYEPAIAPVDFSAALDPAVGTARQIAPGQYQTTFQKADLIICGGASGGLDVPTFELNNARRALKQCKRAGVAFFMKQLGTKPTDRGVPFCRWSKHDKHGRIEEFPADLRVRQMPQSEPRAGDLFGQAQQPAEARL